MLKSKVSEVLNNIAKAIIKYKTKVQWVDLKKCKFCIIRFCLNSLSIGMKTTLKILFWNNVWRRTKKTQHGQTAQMYPQITELTFFSNQLAVHWKLIKFWQKYSKFLQICENFMKFLFYYYSPVFKYGKKPIRSKRATIYISRKFIIDEIFWVCKFFRVCKYDPIVAVLP